MWEEQSLRQRLQADFEYNLKLVEERDGELAKYEAAVVELRLALNQLMAENSELKVYMMMGVAVNVLVHVCLESGVSC